MNSFSVSVKENPNAVVLQSIQAIEVLIIDNNFFLIHIPEIASLYLYLLKCLITGGQIAGVVAMSEVQAEFLQSFMAFFTHGVDPEIS